MSLLSLQDYDQMMWKFLISRFKEDRNTWQRFSLSFCELRYSPLEFNANIWQTIKRVTIRAMNFEAGEFTFWVTSSMPLLSSLLSQMSSLQNLKEFFWGGEPPPPSPLIFFPCPLLWSHIFWHAPPPSNPTSPHYLIKNEQSLMPLNKACIGHTKKHGGKKVCNILPGV